jgi:hypothetical protein
MTQTETQMNRIGELNFEIAKLQDALRPLYREHQEILDAMNGRPVQMPTLTLPRNDALIAG